MEGPFSSAALGPEAALAGAVAGFFELLKSFGAHATSGAGAAPDWTALARTLGAQFEQWLKGLPAAGAAHAAAAGMAPPGPWPQAGAFAPGSAPWAAAAVPLGPAAAGADEVSGAWQLLVSFAQLQGRLAGYWSEIANASAQKFSARLRGTQPSPTPEGALQLYELWVECAEEAYGATVRSGEFCRLQAQLTNTGAALLLAQRRHADAIARACGLPTREEADALQRQIRELRARLEEHPPAARTRAPRPRAKPAGRGGRRPRKRRN